MKCTLAFVLIFLVACSKDKDKPVPTSPVQTGKPEATETAGDTEVVPSEDMPTADSSQPSPIVNQISEREIKPESELPCLNAVQKLSPGTSANIECLKAKDPASLAVLCSSNGIEKTTGFVRYTEYSAKFDAALKEVEDFRLANPNQDIPIYLKMELGSADDEWMIYGYRTEVKIAIEGLRRHSVDCSG